MSGLEMQGLKRLAVIGFAALLAGCAGGATRVVPPAVGNQSASSGAREDAASESLATMPDPGGKSRLTLKITIPAPPHRDGGAFPAQKGARGYVSPGSKGMTLVWSGKSSGTKAFDLTSNNKNCTGSPLVCNITLPLKPGKYKTNVNLYDLAPVGGQIPYNAHLLSTASNVAFSIKKGKPTGISPKLEGIEGSLSIGPLPNQCAGVAFGPTPFTVTAFDADGYPIAGTYAMAITLTDSDTSGATAIATSGADNPPPDILLSSSDVATLAWNGNPIPGGEATIDANAGKYVFTSAQFTPQVTKGFKLLSYTGGSQNFTVPVCAATVYIVVAGAQGGSTQNYAGYNLGGYGGETGATIPTTPGEALAIYVGGAGGNGSYSNQGYGGFNGGAQGTNTPSEGLSGGGGGGASDARQGGSALTNRVVVAGGGGGSGGPFNASGGSGGGLGGGAGSNGPCLGEGYSGKGVGGGGGTQTSGGSSPANPGTLGTGGGGYAYCGLYEIATGSGGGGGGYYGGGGGVYGGGGGGGSAFAEASATNVIMNSGQESGDGFVELCWGYSNNKCGPADPVKGKHRGPRSARPVAVPRT